MMTLDEAIEHCEEVVKITCGECAKEHLQLAEWLRELKKLREQSQSIQSKRGKWIIKDDTERFIAQCNCCRYIEDSRRIKNFCPNCGAKMEETE